MENITRSNHPTIDGLTRLFGLVCLTIPLLYWPPAFFAASLPREALIAVSAGLALILFGIQAYRSCASLNWHPIIILMLAFLVWTIISYYWSVDKGSSQLAITQFTSLIILALLAAQLSHDAVIRYVLPFALIAATLAGLIGIFQYLGFNPIAFRQQAPPASTFVNCNYAANYFDLITPVAFAFLLIQTRPGSVDSVLGATAFTASFAYIVIAQTRGSWLGLVVALIALAIFIALKKDFRQLLMKRLILHRYAITISLATVIALGFAEPKVEPVKGKVDAIVTLSADSSISTRLMLYQNALVGIKDRPLLGVGYGAFISGFTPYTSASIPITEVNQNRVIPYLHSEPLQMVFELGIPGGLLAITVFVLVIGIAWRIVSSSAPTQQRLIGLGLMLALLTSGAHAWVDFPLRLPTSAFFFWLFCGLTIGLYTEIVQRETIKLTRSTAIIVIVTGLLFTAYTGDLYQRYLQANRDVREAKFSAINKDCKKVFKLSDRAMDDFGRDHLTVFWFAKVYSYCDAPTDQKMQAMNRVLALSPNMPLAHLTRARLELQSENLESAAGDYNKYRELLPHRKEGYEGLARVAMELNDREEALFWLQQAIAKAPDDPKLQALLAQIGNESAQETGKSAD